MAREAFNFLIFWKTLLGWGRMIGLFLFLLPLFLGTTGMGVGLIMAGGLLDSISSWAVAREKSADRWLRIPVHYTLLDTFVSQISSGRQVGESHSRNLVHG